MLRRRRVLVSRNIKTSHQINVEYAKRKARRDLTRPTPSSLPPVTPFATAGFQKKKNKVSYNLLAATVMLILVLGFVFVHLLFYFFVFLFIFHISKFACLSFSLSGPLSLGKYYDKVVDRLKNNKTRNPNEARHIHGVRREKY